MGVHARRAARRTTPLVAAAAGIGTVAAMLVCPLPASAASYIADPTYGKASPTDPNVDRAARGGFTDTLGIGAINFNADRYVLGQRQGGPDPRPIRLSKFDSTGKLDGTFPTASPSGTLTLIPGSGTGGTPAIPASFTATHLLADGTYLYLIGYADVSSAWNAVVIRIVRTTGAIDTGYGTGTTAGSPPVFTAGGGVALLGTGLSDTTYAAGFTIADAAIATNGKLAVETMAWTSGGVVHDNRIAQLTAGATGGVLDTAAFAPSGWAALPPSIGSALSVGGITYLTGASVNKLAGVAQIPGTSSDSQSAVFELTLTGVAETLAGGSGGVSTALETPFDARGWANEALADVVEDPSTPGGLVVAGRAGSSLFLARLDPTGALDPTFNETGVSDTVASNCATGEPEFVYGGTAAAPGNRYWMSNDCGSTGEVFRFRTSGTADVDFGNGGMVRIAGGDFGFDGSATAEPITFDGAVTGSSAIVGAGTVSTVVSQPQYDIAGWRIVQQTPASITTQPSSVSVNTGSPAVFTVGATGSPAATYQWQAAPSGTDNWMDLSDGFGTTGTSSFQLTVASVVAAQNGNRYRVKVSNGGPPVFSSPVTLAINGTPQITGQPANKSVPKDASSVSFTTSYIGTAPVSSAWQSRYGDHGEWAPVSGSNFTISSGTGTATLTVNKATAAVNWMQFRATLTNALGQTTSMPAVLEVTGIPPVPPVTPEPEPEPGNHSARGDYNDDGKTDIATFRPSDGSFHWMGGSSTPLGMKGDIRVVGNFNNTPGSDIGVFRPSDGTWHIAGMAPVKYGVATDKPVPADYDGDGKTDIGVFRPSNGKWYIQGMTPMVYGQSGDVPVAVDYNGDGKTDIGVFRPSTGKWYVKGMAPMEYGRSGDVPVPADYNGDGKTDIGVFRPSNGTWYIKGMAPKVFGQSGDVPVSGDFNGDGNTDLAYFRPSNTTWYVWGSAPVQFGEPGDVPVPR